VKTPEITLNLLVHLHEHISLPSFPHIFTLPHFVRIYLIILFYDSVPRSVTVFEYMFSSVHIYMFSSVHIYMFSSVHIYMFSSVHIYMFSSVHIYMFSSVHIYKSVSQNVS